MLTRKSLIFGTLLILFAFNAESFAQTSQADQKGTEPKSSKVVKKIDDLAASLTKLGYSVVPLERMISGHLVAHVEINDSKKLRFVCDSGSGGTLITPKTCENLELKTNQTDQSAGGVGGADLGVATAQLTSFRIGGTKQEMAEILVIDIAHVNEQFEAIGENPVHGIIGSDWMQKHNALLDVASKRMFFKNQTQKK